MSNKERIDVNELLPKIKKYEPEVIKLDGVANMLLMARQRSLDRNAQLVKAYSDTDRAYKAWRDRVIRNNRSNNWLKMHGYSMRRKCH